MSSERVYSLYTTYFGSSKAESNTQIGALGLGSKSPFAYTNSFTIETVCDGHKGLYTCYLNNEGLPQIAEVAAFETDEANGTIIRMPVQAEDIITFIHKAVALFWSFEVEPTIVRGKRDYDNIKEDALGSVDVASEGDGWKLYNKYPRFLSKTSHSLFIKMGNIVYPVKDKLLAQNNLQNDAAILFLTRSSFILDCPIGTCDIAPSREEIDYDLDTIAYIHNRAKLIRTSFLQDINDQISKETNGWNAMMLSRKIVSNIQQNALKSLEKSTFTVGGSKYPYVGYVDFETAGKNLFEVYSTGNTLNRKRKYTNKVCIHPSSKYIFLSITSSKHIESGYYSETLKRFLADQAIATSNPTESMRIVAVLNATQADWDIFGNPPVIEFDSLEIIKRSYASVAGHISDVLVPTLNNDYGLSTWAELLESQDNVYVIQKYGRSEYVTVTSEGVDVQVPFCLNDVCDLFDYLPDAITPKVHIINRRLRASLKGEWPAHFKSWEEALDNSLLAFLKQKKKDARIYLTAEATAKYAVNVDSLAEYLQNDEIFHPESSFVDLMKFSKIKESHNLTYRQETVMDYITLASRGEKCRAIRPEAIPETLEYLGRKFGVNIDILVAGINSAMEKYPLLPLFTAHTSKYYFQRATKLTASGEYLHPSDSKYATTSGIKVIDALIKYVAECDNLTGDLYTYSKCIELRDQEENKLTA
jgi:hypothetical protein